jgi:hypothetical protein
MESDNDCVLSSFPENVAMQSTKVTSGNSMVTDSLQNELYTKEFYEMTQIVFSTQDDSELEIMTFYLNQSQKNVTVIITQSIKNITTTYSPSISVK